MITFEINCDEFSTRNEVAETLREIANRIDEWLSHSSKVLAYIGEDYEDCCAQIAKECHLNSDDEEELLANAQVRRLNDGFFIESVPINGFHPDF